MFISPNVGRTGDRPCAVYAVYAGSPQKSKPPYEVGILGFLGNLGENACMRFQAKHTGIYRLASPVSLSPPRYLPHLWRLFFVADGASMASRRIDAEKFASAFLSYSTFATGRSDTTVTHGKIRTFGTR